MKNSRYESSQEGIQYTYQMLENNIIKLKSRYHFIESYSIGKSVENRKIYILKIGEGPRKIFICGGTHGCEWITVPLLMRWIQEVCHLYVTKDSAYGKSIEELFKRATIHILPMVNPDGIELQINGLSPTHPHYKNLIQWNGGSDDFSKWKSNIRGVDLNRNFNAKWEESVKIGESLGVTGPWLEIYGGSYPESEPETRAVAHYTRAEDFDVVLSYHSQGEEIYWKFDGIEIPGAKTLGRKLAKSSGYSLCMPDENSAYAGYKDWFIQAFKKPGYTIECGLGENPLPMSQFNKIYNENFELILVAAWGE